VPSLQDTANQINNTLTQIQTNTSTSAATDLVIKTEIATLVAQEQADFSNLSAGLAKIIDEQNETNALLNYERQQNDTIICWLTKIADLLCTVVHRLDTEIEIETGIHDDVKQMKATGELVYGSQTVEVLRLCELNKRVSECCPKPKPDPKPCFEPCTEPPYAPYKPQTGDYQPLPPVQQNPAGSGGK
jgi:hypothetical protein